MAATAAQAAVHNLAADWSTTSNPNGVWSYGYLSSEMDLHTANGINTFTDNPGPFVAFDTYTDGTIGWSTGDFPGADVGQFNKVTQAQQILYGNGVDLPGDFPSIEGEDPNYPTGAVGGHSAATPFLTGFYAIKYTAPSTGPVDIDVRAWQATRYAQPSRSQTRSQGVMIIKEAGGNYTDLVRAPLVTRYGFVNLDGTPVHNLTFADPVNDPNGWDSLAEDISYAIKDSKDPNVYRVRNLQLNAGESVLFSMIGYDDGASGFMAFDMDVRTGADRVTNTRWSLNDDFGFNNPRDNPVATGIGPEQEWSYGVQKNGSFVPFDRIMTHIPPETGATPGRDRSGWVQNCPSWHLSGVPDPIINGARIVPGIMKDYDGHNFTRPLSGGIPTADNGDFNAGDVVMALPDAAVDPSQTGIIRWTAPRTMSVNVDGNLWRATLPIGQIDTRLVYSVYKNGVELTNGTVNELGRNSAGGDTNAFTPHEFALSNVAVNQGDNLELRVAPLNPVSASTTADFDRTNTVDFADYTKWVGDFTVNDGSDADGDGDSDGADFLAWQRTVGSTVNLYVGLNFDINESAASIAARAGVVPEPGSIVLALLGVTGFLRRRRAA